MSFLRNSDWVNDDQLKSALEGFVKKNLRRTEILDYMKRDFAQYTWSTRTLDCRLSFLEIKYIDYNTSLENVKKEHFHRIYIFFANF